MNDRGRMVQLSVGKNGIVRVLQACTLLGNAGNQRRGAVLAEPFPGTVSHGVILVLVIVNSQLCVVELGIPTAITTLELCWVR